jgi:uncharacterized coiled-coil protein SlyX
MRALILPLVALVLVGCVGEDSVIGKQQELIAKQEQIIATLEETVAMQKQTISFQRATIEVYKAHLGLPEPASVLPSAEHETGGEWTGVNFRVPRRHLLDSRCYYYDDRRGVYECWMPEGVCEFTHVPPGVTGGVRCHPYAKLESVE